MSQSRRSIVPAPSPAIRFAEIQEAAKRLAEAYRQTVVKERSPWYGALPWLELREAGLTAAGLLWLVSGGFVDHGVYQPGDGAVPPDPPTDVLRITRKTHLVLTSHGSHFLGDCALQPSDVLSPVLPCWYPARRELRVGPHLIKVFRQPADVQELIFQAFAEDGWPMRIDSPLSPPKDRRPQLHLAKTVDNLNRAHQARLIRFRGDGRGEGIMWCWRPLKLPASDGRARRKRGERKG